MRVYFTPTIGISHVLEGARRGFPGFDRLELQRLALPYLRWPLQALMRPRKLWEQCVAAAEAVTEDSLVCVSLIDLAAYFPFTLFYHALAQRFPRKRPRMVVGGSLLPMIDEHDFCAAFPRVDTVVVGPGEGAIVKVLEAATGGGRFPRLVYGDPGDPVRFPHPGLLDVVAPGTRVLYCIMRPGSCAWGRCKFCHHMRKPGPSDVPSFIDEALRFCHDHDVTHIYVLDNNIAPADLELFLRAYDRRRISRNVPMSFFGLRLDRQLLELAPLLAKLRVVREVAWGLESFSQSVLRRWCKGTNVRDFAPILHAFREAGVRNELYMLLGLPLSTDEEIEENGRGARDAAMVAAEMRTSWFLLSPGTDVYAHPDAYRVQVGERYRVCDAFGYDFLGPQDIRTKFLDFVELTPRGARTRIQEWDRYRRWCAILERMNFPLEMCHESSFLGSACAYSRTSAYTLGPADRKEADVEALVKRMHARYDAHPA